MEKMHSPFRILSRMGFVCVAASELCVFRAQLFIGLRTFLFTQTVTFSLYGFLINLNLPNEMNKLMGKDADK